MKNLSHAAFKVYMALLFNKDNFRLEYSPQYVSDITGIHVDTARKVLKQLEMQGYLKEIDITHYIFSERPNKFNYDSFYEAKKYSW